jgi:hypothetical protein
MTAGGATGRAGPDRLTVLRQLRQPRPEPRIDVFVDHFGRRLDMGIGVVYAQPVLHHAPSSMTCCLLYTPASRCAETPDDISPKMLDHGRQIA